MNYTYFCLFQGPDMYPLTETKQIKSGLFYAIQDYNQLSFSMLLGV